MKLLSYLAFVACLEGLAFAAIAYFLRPEALLNRIAAAIGLLNGWWNFCQIFSYGSSDMAAALVFDRWSYVAILGLNPLLGWFFLKFAGASNRLIAGIVVPVSLVSASVAFGYLTSGFPRASFHPGPWGNGSVLSADQRWSTVSDVLSIGLDIVYVALLVRKRLTTNSWRLKRLVTLMLAGILSAVGAYLVLGFISQTFGIPGLIFLPGALITLLYLYLIAQYGFLKPETPRLESHAAEALSQPAFLLDRQAKILGANAPAKSLLPPGQEAGLDLTAVLGEPEAFRARWSALRSQDPGPEAFLDTPHGPLRLSPHYDRFGDFVGAAAFLVGPRGDSRSHGSLSGRETEVLKLLVAGSGNQAIGDLLFISRDTVKRHVHSILAKTGARSRRELLIRFGGATR